MKSTICLLGFLALTLNHCTDRHENITTITEVIRNNHKLKVEVICKSQFQQPRFTLKTGETREISFTSDVSHFESFARGYFDSVFIVFDDGKVKKDTSMFKKIRINPNEKKNILYERYYTQKKISDSRTVIEYSIDSLDYQEAQ